MKQSDLPPELPMFSLATCLIVLAMALAVPFMEEPEGELFGVSEQLPAQAPETCTGRACCLHGTALEPRVVRSGIR